MITMRNKALGLIAGLLLTGVGSAATVWMPTDNDVNVTDLSLLIPGFQNGDFRLFDDDAAGDLSNSSNLILADGDQLSFAPDPGNPMDWTVTGSNGTLSLSGSNNFIFAAFVDPSGYARETSSTEVAPNQWSIAFDSGGMLVTDVTPVPLPPAALLFGSGVIGLMALGRRRRARVQAAVVC